ncbi:MAG TPA: hypothetical protein VG605_18530, partial [Puia sp.]|nr:hypothetical protein [Puia sp.]
MKSPLLLSLTLLTTFTISAQRSSSIDSALAKNITINGICLCRTTLAELQKADPQLKQTEVEEMELGKRCGGGTFGEYENGKGYISEKFPGMIFQKDQDDDYIGNIRLSRGFHGHLPNGSTIEIGHFLVKDIFALYPNLKDQWGSRNCSDYWSLSNDTIRFYVRIDTAKKPQYPIDEPYYLNRSVDGISLSISCYHLNHASEATNLAPSDAPMYYIDSIRTNAGFLEQYQPSEIAYIQVYKDSNAIKLVGEQGRNGVIYVFSKTYVRQHYWEYLQSKSSEYRTMAPDLKT